MKIIRYVYLLKHAGKPNRLKLENLSLLRQAQFFQRFTGLGTYAVKTSLVPVKSCIKYSPPPPMWKGFQALTLDADWFSTIQSVLERHRSIIISLIGLQIRFN